MSSFACLLPIGPHAKLFDSQLAVCTVLQQLTEIDQLMIFLDSAPKDIYDFFKENYTNQNIKILESLKNIGVGKALNLLYKASNQNIQYITRIDADDYCKPNRFNIQMTYLNSHNIDILGGGINWNKDMYCPPRIKDTKEAKEKIRELVCPVFHPTMMIRRIACEKIINKYSELYPESDKYKYAEDFALHIRALNIGLEYANLDIPLIYYTKHPGQSSVLHENEQRSAATLALREITF